MLTNLLNPLFGIADDRGIYIFGLEIYYYAFCIVGAMIAAALLSALLMKRRNMSTDFVFTIFLVCIPTAIISARLFSVLTDGSGIQNFFAFRDGGLSITGGVIGGVLAGLLVCKIRKMEFLRVADCIVLNILFAMMIGRWGNFFNAEVYGGEVTNPALQWFPFAVPVSSNPDLHGIGSFSDPNAVWHYAFFFYEGCINLLGWAILFTFTWFRKKKPNGIPTFLTFVWFGVVRMIMEPLRDPSYILNAHGVPWSFVFAVLIWSGGLAAILILLLVNHYKEGALIGSVRGDPCGISNYMTPYKDDKPYYSKINMFGKKYPFKGEELNEVVLPPIDGELQDYELHRLPEGQEDGREETLLLKGDELTEAQPTEQDKEE